MNYKPLSPNHYYLSAIKGQSLIEVLVAIAIVALVALGLVRVTTSSVRNTSYSNDQNQASILAQKKISEIIAQKNTNPASFFNSLPFFPDDTTTNPAYCILTLLVNKTADLPTTTPDYISAKMAKILVKVYWGEKDGTCTSCDCGTKNYNNNQEFETQITN